ncbi:MAG: tRNA uridine-5-carboxymethylaminomethyl(34) synthesis GTPase MnmE, partial [Tissierellia bacterium]|nr:tRNA uridine-5-carboxymethylaminomethyl(34) synthesis GTPase MnmE [Tissierellia bacterium]
MDHTIAAISTATGEAGIGIVRMSGKDSFEIGNKIFRGINSKEVTIKDNRKMKYGHIYDGEKLIDEVLICFMKGPHTYTREDIVEIYTHGGVISVKKVLDTLLKNGAEVADRGEFTKRAFLNGRLDLSQAEAVIDMIKAKTDKAYDASLNQLEGSLKNKIGEYRDKMLNV